MEYARKMQRARVQKTGMEKTALSGAALTATKQIHRAYRALVMVRANSPRDSASASPVTRGMLVSSSLVARTVKDYVVKASANAFQDLAVRTVIFVHVTMIALAMDVAHLRMCANVRMAGLEKAVK